MTSQIKTDARFAMIPEWLLDHTELSHAAIRLYCVLDRYADAQGHAYPGRKLLADRLGVKSADTVDRALKELVTVGAVSVSKRYDNAGDPTSNLYTVHRYPPEGVAARMRPPSRTDQDTWPHDSGDGGRTDAALNENQLNKNPLTPNADELADVDASSPACRRHPNGDGKNCRDCGTNPKAVREQRARELEAERRAATAAEFANARAAREAARAQELSEETARVVAEAKATIAKNAAAARRRPA